MKDPMKMLRQVQQMQDRMTKLQKELESETVEASAGGGAVTVVATGTQKLVSVRIDPDAASDPEMLQDLVVAEPCPHVWGELRGLLLCLLVVEPVPKPQDEHRAVDFRLRVEIGGAHSAIELFENLRPPRNALHRSRW